MEIIYNPGSASLNKQSEHFKPSLAKDKNVICKEEKEEKVNPWGLIIVAQVVVKVYVLTYYQYVLFDNKWSLCIDSI